MRTKANIVLVTNNAAVLCKLLTTRLPSSTNTEKRRMENIVKDAINYYIDNKEDMDIYNKTNEYINKNINNVNIKIEVNDEYITISINKKYKSIYNILNLNDEIKVKYIGYYIDKRIVKG